MPRVLVADKIAEAGLALLRAHSGIEFDVLDGLSPEELAQTIGDYDGVLIRSAVKITRETLAKSGRLMAVS